MELHKSKFLNLSLARVQEILGRASQSVPTAAQLADQLTGYGWHYDYPCDVVVIWDKKRIWMMSRTAWTKWNQRPTVSGAMYDRWGFQKTIIHWHYRDEWNQIIPDRVSDISRRYWAIQ